MSRIKKLSNENTIDFILNNKGDFEEYLIPFMLEQNYTSIDDFLSTGQYIETTKNNNYITNYLEEHNKVVTYIEGIEYQPIPSSFDTSFDVSFETII